jgi:hypothetical protein
MSGELEMIKHQLPRAPRVGYGRDDGVCRPLQPRRHSRVHRQSVNADG